MWSLLSLGSATEPSDRRLTGLSDRRAEILTELSLWRSDVAGFFLPRRFGSSPPRTFPQPYFLPKPLFSPSSFPPQTGLIHKPSPWATYPHSRTPFHTRHPQRRPAPAITTMNLQVTVTQGHPQARRRSCHRAHLRQPLRHPDSFMHILRAPLPFLPNAPLSTFIHISQKAGQSRRRHFILDA